MDKDSFWNLVENSRKGAEDVDEKVEKLYALVRELDPHEILEFDRCFLECVRDAFRGDLWAAAYIIKGGCSDDGFDYFLGWLIAQGRKYYEAALANPERTGDHVKPGEEVECGGIWSIAARAYEDKTGRTDFYDMVPIVNRTLIGDLFEEDKVNTFTSDLLRNFGVSNTSPVSLHRRSPIFCRWSRNKPECNRGVLVNVPDRINSLRQWISFHENAGRCRLEIEAQRRAEPPFHFLTCDIALVPIPKILRGTPILSGENFGITAP